MLDGTASETWLLSRKHSVLSLHITSMILPQKLVVEHPVGTQEIKDCHYQRCLTKGVENWYPYLPGMGLWINAEFHQK